MVSTKDQKIHLPPLNTSFTPTLASERKLGTDTTKSLRRDILLYRSMAIGTESPQQFSSSQQYNRDSATFVDLSVMMEAQKLRNLQIEATVRRMNKKLNFTGKDKSQKFEEKFKVFETLNTFVDIKDYLKQLNVLNSDIKQRSSRLPPMNTDEIKDSVPNQISLLNSALPNGKQSPKQSPIATRLLDSDTYIKQKSPRKVKNNNVSFGDRLKVIRKNVSQYTNIKPQQPPQKSMTSERRDTYAKILESTNIMLTQLNEADMRLPTTEESDVNTFYQELQKDLANENFEKIDYGHVEVQQDEIDYYKKLLALKEEHNRVDEQYYLSYKGRAEKVIRLLRKATKNIFNKKFDLRRDLSKKLTNEGLTDRGGMEKKQEISADLREECKQEIETFLTSADLWKDPNDDEMGADLEDRFFKMLRKINALKESPLAQPQGSKTARVTEGEEEKTFDNAKNHAINKVYKNYMKTIIECAEAQENKIKNSKQDLKKDIKKLEIVYSKDMEKYAPKGLQSVRMTLDVNATSKAFLDKPVKKNISRKALNALID